MTTPVNGIMVLQGIVPSQIAAAPVGVKVIDMADDNGIAFTASQIAQMEAGNSLLLGYFSIGEAENFRSYFSSLPTSVLGPQDPSWPGDYQVAYWTDTWKAVCASTIDQMIGLGYGGAYFDVVSECETAWAHANAPGGDAKGAMVSLIQYLADYAHAKDPGFQIWVNAAGAEDLMTNSTFVNAINGAFEEELFYQDNGTPQPQAAVNYNLNLLDHLLAAGKSLITVEYVTGTAAVSTVEADAAAAGIGYYIANPNLSLNGVDTEGFTTASLPPVVDAVRAKPACADLGVSGVATFTVTFSEAVTVTGAPKLTLNDGGGAVYSSGSGTNTLTFTYTVLAGQNATRLAVSGVALPSGTAVKDAAGNAADFTKVAGNPPGRVVVDTLRTRISIGTGSGQTVNAGAGSDVVTLSGGSATIVFHGSNDVAFLGGGGIGASATIIDQSQGLLVYVAANGVDTISGLATDPTAVIDLLGNIGGYRNVTQVMSALASDKAGGTLLPLNTGHYIDLPGVTPANLHTTNFHIG